MREIKLQSDFAVEFHNSFPKKRGRLFHVSNERNNKVQAFNARAIGIVPGVSDFIYVDKMKYSKAFLKRASRETGIKKDSIILLLSMLEKNKDSVKLTLIELKTPNSRHKREHIESQLRWARTMEACGGTWRLCRTVEEAMSCTKGKFKGLTIEDVENMLKSVKTKTIKF